MAKAEDEAGGGIVWTEAEIEDADVVAYVFDAGAEDIREDSERLESIYSDAANQGKTFLLIANKIDLSGGRVAGRSRENTPENTL